MEHLSGLVTCLWVCLGVLCVLMVAVIIVLIGIDLQLGVHLGWIARQLEANAELAQNKTAVENTVRDPSSRVRERQDRDDWFDGSTFG